MVERAWQKESKNNNNDTQ